MMKKLSIMLAGILLATFSMGWTFATRNLRLVDDDLLRDSKTAKWIASDAISTIQAIRFF